MNTETLKGNWNVTKGKLKQMFAQLTDSDLTYIEGQEDELLGRLQQKTGQSLDALERILREEHGARFSAARFQRFHPNRSGAAAGKQPASSSSMRPS